MLSLLYRCMHTAICSAFTVSLNAFCQGSKQIKMWTCDVRMAGWVWKLCPLKYSNGLSSCAHSVCPLMMSDQYFRHFCCGTNSTKVSIHKLSEFTVVPLGNKFTRITHFSSQKSATRIFHTGHVPLNSFFLGDVMWHHSINCCFDSTLLWQLGAESSHLLCYIKVSSDFFSCFFVCICQLLAPKQHASWMLLYLPAPTVPLMDNSSAPSCGMFYPSGISPLFKNALYQ